MASRRLHSVVSILTLGLLVATISPAASQYLYRVRSDGVLEWTMHLGSTDGRSSWIGPRAVGADWQGYWAVFSAGEGVIYAIRQNGDLLWFRHKGYHDGSTIWVGPEEVGSGWQRFKAVFSGGEGVIYALESDGTLLWYRHAGWRDGVYDWEGPNVVAENWNFETVFAGAGGSIYGIQTDGTLMWHRHLGLEDGSLAWEGPNAVGFSWNRYSQVSASAGGVIYSIQPDGQLLWQRHRGYLDGSDSWDGPTPVGSNWSFSDVIAAEEPIEGYCWPLSAVPGETISFHVSSPVDYKVVFARYRRVSDQNVSIPITSPQAIPADLQAVPPEPWQSGCGWSTSFQLTVPLSWGSGIYAAECKDPAGRTSRVVFIVKPRPSLRGDFAVLANTNTWCAYNDWGGKSKYDGPAQVLSFFRPNPETRPIEDGGMNRRTRAELWVLDWLASTGYRFDVYTDDDFDRGIWGGYDALILTTHPEYWSLRMRDNLEAYLAGGGCLLYMGGDGMFEEVVLSSDGTVATYYPEGQFPVREPSYFRNLNPPRPERSVLGVAFRYDNYFTFAPYQVLRADHHLFEGTGVSSGDLIGEDGFNGGASGWELDTSIPGNAPDGAIVGGWRDDDRGAPPENIELLARGTNVGEDGAFGADMTYYRTPAGGFVFSVGSISFGGSLVVDPVLQRIVLNALDEAAGATSAEEGAMSPPAIFVLGPGQPNPFESSTTIRYEIPEPSRVRLRIFDIQGREVASLVDGAVSAGAHATVWDGRTGSGARAGAGVYLYRLESTAQEERPATGRSASGRVVLLR